MIIRLILLILIIFTVYYYSQRHNQYIKKRKTNLIKLNKIKRINSDEKIVNIIYSIQGYYHYNQEAFEELIKKHSNKNDTVLDTFLGSGTTAFACKNTDRNFNGCEISKEYYNKIIEIL